VANNSQCETPEGKKYTTTQKMNGAQPNQPKEQLRALHESDYSDFARAANTGNPLPGFGDFYNADSGSFSDLISAVSRQVSDPKHRVRKLIVSAVVGPDGTYPQASRLWDKTHPNQPRLKSARKNPAD
jgi:hypothetical protein